MNRALLRASLLALLLAAGLASAQDPLQSYTLASESLSEAVSQLPNDGASARDAISRAANSLRPLSRDTSSPQLVGALERVVERAQTAIDNQSQSDLAVQVAVLRGGLQRLLYESALQAAGDGDLDAARARLAAIAQDAGAEAPAGESAADLLASFEAGMAGVARQKLERAAALLGSDKGAAYVTLAQAYGAFFPVQDSPRLASSLSPGFSQAFQALVGDDADTFVSATAELRAALERFEEAARTGAPGASQAVAAPGGEAGLLEPEAASPASEAPETAAPAASPPAGQAANGALEQELSGFGVSGAVAQQLAAQYRTLGLGSVSAALGQLYAEGARAQLAAQRGEQREALARLAALDASYQRLLTPLLRGSAAERETSALLSRLQRLPELRQQDVALLLGQLEALERGLAGAEASGQQRAMLASEPLWSGWPRLVVLLVLAVLAFLPLRLLNLAFGGANRNWRLIGVALFLLLLPAIYEGLSALFAIVADLSGAEGLRVLSAFSIFQNTLSQLLWAALTLVAIVLASVGLYGICVQFGLLGAPSSKETIVSTHEAPAAQAPVDWDEEF